MNNGILVLVAALAISAGAGRAADIDLPRRGTLGLALAPTPDGMSVARVREGSDAWQAGVRQGDELEAINGIEITDYLDVQAATHQLSYREPAEVRLRRDGEAMTVQVTPRILPLGRVEGAEVDYGFIITPSGLRIRTVTMTPLQSALETEAGLPGVVYLQGIPCQSIDLIGGPNHPRGRLFHDLVAAGFAVTFADKPGIGDSDGVPCREGGFEIEVEAYTMAAQAFARNRAVDSGRLYAVGVSMGGFQAPLVADSVDLAGTITWGAGVQPWFDYLITNFRQREWVEPTASAAAADAFFADYRDVMARLIVVGQDLDTVRAEVPDALERVEDAYGPLEQFAGRSLTFHREIDAAPVRAAWERYDGQLLSLHGSLDDISTREDHAWASRIVNRNHPGNARFELLEDVDHGWRSGTSGQISYQFHDRAVAWLVDHASRPDPSED
ncbi:MAG: PDZ domain-containing protein [Pseudomonadota bacterium]